MSEPPDAASEPAILEHWDHQRAAAYASGNASALQRLYVPGSQAGLRDVQLLKSYVARGLLVTGMKMRLLSARVIHSDPRRLVLLVRDQLARAIARAEKERDVHRTLPTDHASSHVVTLSRSGTDQTWRVSTVRVSGGRRRPGR